MLRSLFIFIILSLCTFSTLTAAAFERPQLSDDEKSALERGDAIISVWKDREAKNKPTVSRGGIDIKAPAADVFSIMLDCDRIFEIARDIRECEVLERSETGDWDIRKQKFAVSPVLPKFTSTFRTDYEVTPEGNYVMSIERISGDLKVQQGRWDIIRMGPEETRVIYQAAIKPALPVPAKIIRKQVAVGIPDILRNLRDLAASEHVSVDTATTPSTEVDAM